ncbi:MAG TPA: competence type IV pilus assembly protein ComGB [Bacillota bacterium]|nr:competence type IV pilus assembly protein ComGB [Bacillota bacterium]
MGIFPNKLFICSKQKLSNELQLRFLRRLSRSLTNGYSLLQALDTIRWDKQLEPTADRVILLLKNGHSLDDVLEKQHFHPSITSYLFFVQANGDLEGTLIECIHMFEKRIDYVKQFQQIIRYPLILCIIFFLLLLFLKQMVLPSFIDLFQKSSDASTTVTISIMIIDILGNVLLIGTILIITLSFLWHLNKQKVSIQTQLKVYNLIPIYRTYLRLQTSFLLATHLSTLLKTGMPIKEILTILSQQKNVPIIAHYSRLMADELRRGVYITKIMSQFTFVENQLATIFQKNIQSDVLERDLSTYAQLLTEEIHRKILKTITMIQPAFFILIACVIIFIYITLMWPMFQLIQTM